LASLLKELRGLTDEDFKAALNDAAGPPSPAARKKAPKKSAKPRKDSPVARVAKVLRETRGLADHDAQVWLRAALQRDGVDVARIPATSDEPLEIWLEVLFETVRSADALAVAQSG